MHSLINACATSFNSVHAAKLVNYGWRNNVISLYKCAVTMQASQTRNLLQATSPYTVGTTAGVNPPYQSLTLPQVYALIRAANANTTNSAGLGVKQLVSVSKQGVAGNGLCEAGEMPSTDGNYTGAPMPLLHLTCL